LNSTSSIKKDKLIETMLFTEKVLHLVSSIYSNKSLLIVTNSH